MGIMKEEQRLERQCYTSHIKSDQFSVVGDCCPLPEKDLVQFDDSMLHSELAERHSLEGMGWAGQHPWEGASHLGLLMRSFFHYHQQQH